MNIVDPNGVIHADDSDRKLRTLCGEVITAKWVLTFSSQIGCTICQILTTAAENAANQSGKENTS